MMASSRLLPEVTWRYIEIGQSGADGVFSKYGIGVFWIVAGNSSSYVFDQLFWKVCSLVLVIIYVMYVCFWACV